MNIDSASQVFLNNTEIIRIIKNGATIWEKVVGPDYFYLKNISNQTGTFYISGYTSGSLEYSLDGTNWNSYNFTTPQNINVSPNTSIYLRGTNFKDYNASDSVINFNKTYIIGGNFLSLSNYSTMETVNTIPFGIVHVFQNQTNLTSAQNLNFGNATSVDDNALISLFYNCTSLTTAPDLSNITTVEEEGLAGCFQNCTSLTTGPNLSNITSVGEQGLQLCFSGCTSLTTAPNLSNLTSVGDYGFESCFDGCTSLTTGPNLRNLTSVGTAAFNLCFYYCSKLNNVTAPNIRNLIANDVLSWWLSGAGTQVTGTKVVNVPTGATIATDSTSGIPSGWSRVNY